MTGKNGIKSQILTTQNGEKYTNFSFYVTDMHGKLNMIHTASMTTVQSETYHDKSL